MGGGFSCSELPYTCIYICIYDHIIACVSTSMRCQRWQSCLADSSRRYPCGPFAALSPDESHLSKLLGCAQHVMTALEMWNCASCVEMVEAATLTQTTASGHHRAHVSPSHTYHSLITLMQTTATTCTRRMQRCID